VASTVAVTRQHKYRARAVVRTAEGLLVPAGEAAQLGVTGERYDSTGEGEYTKTLAGGTVFVLRGRGKRARVEPFRLAGWRRGQTSTLQDAIPRTRDAPAHKAITLTPDYECWPSPDPDGAPWCAVDYKGVVTAVFRLKATLWAHVYPTVPLYVVGADGIWRRA
jgi:hypothetical protein